MKAWVNGEFLPEEQVRVSLLSHSFSRGSAIFETFDVTETARGPALFRPDAHVERFINSAEALHVPLPAGKEELIDILKTAVRTNSMSSGGVKLFAYYSEPEFRLIPKERSAKLAVFCFELSGIFGEGCGESTKPLTAGMSTIRKSSPSFLPVHAKACGLYVGGFLALSEAVEQGYDDVIMLDELGFVAEGAVEERLLRQGRRRHNPQAQERASGDHAQQRDRGREGPGPAPRRDGRHTQAGPRLRRSLLHRDPHQGLPDPVDRR